MDPIMNKTSAGVVTSSKPPRSTNPEPTKPTIKSSYYINYPDILPGGFQPGKKSRLF